MIELFATTSRQRDVTLTLSRAHKVNERISAKLNELRVQATQDGQAVGVQVYSGPEQVALIKAKAAKALGVAAMYVELVSAQRNLRQAVGVANVQTGVADVLGQIEAKKKLITLCDSIIALAPTPNTMTTEALAARAVGERVATSDYGGAMAVSGVTSDNIEPYAKARVQLEREVAALSDKLADLNAAKVTFAMAEDLFEVLSLEPSR